MLDRVSTIVFGLDGLGGAERFADYSQWDLWQRPRQTKGNPNTSSGPLRSTAAAESARTSGTKRKLSYIEARELATIEERIAEAEREVDAKRAALEDPTVTSDAVLLRETCVRMEEAQKTIDTLYARWAELEKKQR
jgi:ATP-binding cassette subfamily F protein uup